MRRMLARVAISGLFAATVGIAGPQPVFACTCVPPEPIGAYVGDPSKLVFTGTVRASGDRGVAVAVDGWFQGGTADVVRFEPNPTGPGFGPQGAACQEPYPPVGSRWLYVAFVARAGQAPQVNSCTAKAALDTEAGVAMLAEAEAAFGRATAPRVADPAPPEPPAAPGDPAAVAAIGAVMAAAVALLFGAVVVAARRGRG